MNYIMKIRLMKLKKVHHMPCQTQIVHKKRKGRTTQMMTKISKKSITKLSSREGIAKMYKSTNQINSIGEKLVLKYREHKK